MLPLIVLWIGYGVSYYEETIIALGALAALVAELMAWRSARGEVAREIDGLRADLASLRTEYTGALARLSAELDAHRAAVAQSLDLDRRLIHLEAAAAAADDDEG